MPNPLPGDGDLVITGTGAQGQVLPIGTIYLAAYNNVSPVAAPGAKLGTGEPASAYGKVGLLHDDMFDIQEADPQIVEYRRGFRSRYFGEVVKQVGQRTVVATIDEVQPVIIASLLGDNLQAVSGGRFLPLSSSVYVHKTMLVVYYDALNSREYHVYSPHVLSRYKFTKTGASGGGGANANFLTLELTLKLITFKDNDQQYRDCYYYEWD